MAPEFALPAVTGERRHRVQLSDYRGTKNVVLAFHPLDWTPTWAVQVPAFNDYLDRFAALNAQVLGISIDSLPCHVAWQKRDIGMMRYPLLSDLYPHGAVAEQFGILRQGAPIPGINERAVFVIDKQGRIAFTKIYPLDQTPDNAELLQFLEGMREPSADRR
jgi:peroxiredoxin